MDWLRDALGQAAPGHSADDLMEAFTLGEEEARLFMKRLHEKALIMTKAGKSEAGALLMFAATTRAVGLAQHAVDLTEQDVGPDSPVVKMWNIVKAVLTAGTAKEGMERLRKLKLK